MPIGMVQRMVHRACVFTREILSGYGDAGQLPATGYHRIEVHHAEETAPDVIRTRVATAEECSNLIRDIRVIRRTYIDGVEVCSMYYDWGNEEFQRRVAELLEEANIHSAGQRRGQGSEGVGP